MRKPKHDPSTGEGRVAQGHPEGPFAARHASAPPAPSAARPLEAVRPPPLPIELGAPCQPPEPPSAAPAPREVEPQVPAVELPELPVFLASGLRTAGARIVDFALAAGAGALVAATELLLLGTPYHPEAVGLADYVAEWLHHNDRPALHGAIIAIVFGMTHNVIAGLRGGQTVGRKLTRTVLVRRSGARLSVPVLVVRTVGSLVSLAAFGAGYFWAIVDRHRRTWHDWLAGTVVVDRDVKNSTAGSCAGS